MGRIPVRHGKIRSLLLAAAFSATAVGAPAPGLAAGPKDGQATLITSDKFVTGDVLAAQLSANEKQAAVGAYVESQAQEGRLLDASAVSVAQIGGGTATWERGSTIVELRSTRWATREGSVKGAIAELAILADEDSAATAGTGAVSGMGLGIATYSGGTRLASYCQTWTVSGSSVTACQQKFKPTSDGSSTRDYYLYNRYGTAVGDDAIPTDWKVVNFDMRSRPRAGTTTTKGMSGYFPSDATQLCNEGGSVSLGVGSLSLTIPLTPCGSKRPIPNATTMTMGLIYDSGPIFGDRTKGLDYEQEVWANQGGTAPNLGFYNYAKFCYLTLATCSGTKGVDGW